MAHKSNQNQPGQEAGSAPGKPPKNREFEDAVTTEISGVLAKAFDGDQAADLSDIYVTDMQVTAHVDPALDDALSPGFLLNERFEIVELVHSGGMGHVYKAVDQRRHPEGSGEIHVAIKMMRPSIAPAREARLSLEREAAKAQSLSHPNIINIFDFDDHGGRFFLVMEWLEGESVNALLRRTSGKRLASEIASTVITGTAAGVQHAHRKNVVHADINPSNIFITDSGEIKLLDFGVARYTTRPEHSEDERIAWVTKPYASPEVLSGLTPVVEDDVFSLACVAYRLLAGRHPFDGTLSLVAKHEGITPQPIPALAEDEWDVLRSALCYERSGRPGDVGDFVDWGVNAVGGDKSVGHFLGRVTSRWWPLPAAIAAAAILAGGIWLFQRGIDDEIATTVDPGEPQEAVTAEPVDAPSIPAIEAILGAARQALSEGQLVAPDDTSARALFRQTLILEPDNAEALQGLRTISNQFVQEAQAALNAGDPALAYAALSVASETDPANPAIDIVDQLLVVKGNGELADARLAVATGELDVAEERLSVAERFAHIDPAAVESLRRQIRQRRDSDQLLDSIAAADALITAGRLRLPEGNNAHALLLDLYGQHGDDARLVASMERLGERLLARAAFATAAMRFAEATELLDAVEALGVMSSEVEAARQSLYAADANGGAANVPRSQVAGEQVDDAVSPENVQGPQLVEQQAEEAIGTDDPQDLQIAEQQTEDAITADDLQDLQIAEQQTAEAPLQAPALEPAMRNEPASQAATPPAEPEIRRQSLQELGIREFVAPKFPRRAVRRSLSGMVEVLFVINADGSTDSIRVLHSEPGDIFSESAVDAVRQWRFEAREKAHQAQITVRFDQAP